MEKIVRRRLADGTIKEYRYRRRRGPAPGSLGAVIQEYRRSQQFLSLSPAAKEVYLRAIGHMDQEKKGHRLYRVAVRDIKRRHIVKLRDSLADRPGIANQLVAVFSVVMEYAVEMEYRETNPARKIKPLQTGQHRRWPDNAIDFALASFPERLRRAVMLALYTGQRQADVLAMKWSDYDGEGIHVVQQKTGQKLRIFCPAPLKAALDAWKGEDRTAVTIIADSRGKPYQRRSFADVFSAEMRKHPELSGLVFHGLRKTAAARLAEAGCTTHEIAAITGHKTLQMLQHYTLEAEQEGRARAAIVKLETFSAGKRRENSA